jgi:hypothetical protein
MLSVIIVFPNLFIFLSSHVDPTRDMDSAFGVRISVFGCTLVGTKPIQYTTISILFGMKRIRNVQEMRECVETIKGGFVSQLTPQLDILGKG